MTVAEPKRDREVRRGAPLRLVSTRANNQPALGCYLPIPNTDVARGLFVLTLGGDRTSAITWFADSSVFPSSDCRGRCGRKGGRRARG